MVGVEDGSPQCGDLRDGAPHGGSLPVTCSTMIMMVIIVVINQGREGLGGGVPPNHMWTPYGFVPFQMGAGRQQVFILVFE